jgi:hypothetical protein
MIIQTILLDPSGAVWADGASNPSSLDPSGTVQVDAEHPARNRKVVGSNPTSGSISAGQRGYAVLPRTALLASLIIPCAVNSLWRPARSSLADSEPHDSEVSADGGPVAPVGVPEASFQGTLLL